MLNNSEDPRASLRTKKTTQSFKLWWNNLVGMDSEEPQSWENQKGSSPAHEVETGVGGMSYWTDELRNKGQNLSLS